MPGLSPRSHARNRDSAAKPTQASNADQGYLMMDKTALGSRSSCAAPAWPNQARGAALPNRSCRRKSEAKISFPPDVIITHCKHPEPARHRTRSSFLATSNVCPRPSPESIPIGHAPPNGLVQPIFRPPARRSPFGCSPSLSRRDARLKMLCVMQDES